MQPVRAEQIQVCRRVFGDRVPFSSTAASGSRRSRRGRWGPATMGRGYAPRRSTIGPGTRLSSSGARFIQREHRSWYWQRMSFRFGSRDNAPPGMVTLVEIENSGPPIPCHKSAANWPQSRPSSRRRAFKAAVKGSEVERRQRDGEKRHAVRLLAD